MTASRCGSTPTTTGSRRGRGHHRLRGGRLGDPRSGGLLRRQPRAAERHSDDAGTEHGPGLDARPGEALEPSRWPSRSPAHRPLTAGGYVFPVYGPSSFGDTFGAPRGDSGGWHHGDDIFAPLGAPLLAVANGMVFSVGWNEIGGNRLWLQDQAGQPVLLRASVRVLAVRASTGTQVKAGDVLGFVGNTGDAATGRTTSTSRSIRSLLFLGYDGAVDPTRTSTRGGTCRTSASEGAGWAPPLAEELAPRPARCSRDGHLDRGRPRPGLAPADPQSGSAHRPGLGKAI